jgi:hypothetical protein
MAALFLALASAVLLAQGGCATALSTALWVVKGHNVKAEYGELKGKRVAVVCRPLVELEFRSAHAHEQIAQEVGRLLDTNIRSIDIVDARDIAQWTDEHDWDDYVELGKSVDADMVLVIELEDFNLYQGQTLYQGRARVSLSVYDVAEEGKVVWSKALPQTLYPPNTGIPTDRPEDDFRRVFVGALGEEIARHFYPHDPMMDFARDSTVLTR